MPRTVTEVFEVYKFDELSQRAKDRALQEYSAHGMDHEWWDAAYEDAKTCFGFCGIRIDRIFYFSGFWSQGDGACFDGVWYASDVKPGKLKDHAPQDAELHRIAAGFEEIAKDHPQAAFKVKHRGHYYHEHCTEFEVEFHDDAFEQLQYDSPEWKARNALLWEVERDLVELARDAMRWIYRTLEKEHEYLTSEEAFKELAEANEWEFTKGGEIRG